MISPTNNGMPEMNVVVANSNPKKSLQQHPPRSTVPERNTTMETTDAAPRPKPPRLTKTYFRRQVAIEAKRRKTLTRAQLLFEDAMMVGDGYCFTCGTRFMWDHVSPEGVAARHHDAIHANHDIRELHEIEVIGPAPGAKKAYERLEREGLRLMKRGKTANQLCEGVNMVLKAQYDRAMAELWGLYALKVPPRELPVLKQVTVSSPEVAMQRIDGLPITTD